MSEGETLVREGDFSYELMAIEEGTATVKRGDQTIAELGPGDFFGEIGVLKNEMRDATVVAKTADAPDHAHALGAQAHARHARRDGGDPADRRGAPVGVAAPGPPAGRPATVSGPRAKPAPQTLVLRLDGGLRAVGGDLHPARLGLLGLGDAHLEHAAVEGRR